MLARTTLGQLYARLSRLTLPPLTSSASFHTRPCVSALPARSRTVAHSPFLYLTPPAALAISRRYGSGVARQRSKKHHSKPRAKVAVEQTRDDQETDPAASTSSSTSKLPIGADEEGHKTSTPRRSRGQPSTAATKNNGSLNTAGKAAFGDFAESKSGMAKMDEDDAETTEQLLHEAAEDDADRSDVPLDDPAAASVEMDNEEAAEDHRKKTQLAEEEEVSVDGVVGEDGVGEASSAKKRRPRTRASSRGKGDSEREATDAVEDDEEETGSTTGNLTGSIQEETISAAGKGSATAPSPQGDDGIANKFLLNAFPEFAEEYVAAGPKANSMPVDEVRVDAAEVAAWRCPACHEVWRCGVFVRCILKNSCPHCSAHHRVSMADARPDLLQLWDHHRNDPFLRPEAIPAESKAMVHWKCPTCRESYTARVRDCVQDKVKCPSCALMRTTSASDLSSEESALLLEWHPLKNGDLRMDQLAPTDQKTKVWWLCASCGHEWEAPLWARLSHSRRSKLRHCPACHGKGTMDAL